jgi:hypothetical protein
MQTLPRLRRREADTNLIRSGLSHAQRPRASGFVLADHADSADILGSIQWLILRWSLEKSQSVIWSTLAGSSPTCLVSRRTRGPTLSC